MDLDLLREPRMETRLRLKFPVASVAKERPNIFLKVVEALRDCSLKNLKERDAYIARRRISGQYQISFNDHIKLSY